tara:strand:- start:26331 stop:26513 length:183 start_codon:yes stop_codon:yes gene_type:complete
VEAKEFARKGRPIVYAKINPSRLSEYTLEFIQTPKLVIKKKIIGDSKATLRTLKNFLSIN